MRTLNTTTLDNMESFIIDYQKRKGKSPSFREVMKALNMSSLNLVRTYISKEDKEKLINLIVAQKRSANPSESTFLRPVATFIEEIQFLETYPIRKRKVDFGYGAIDTYQRKI